MKGTQYAMAMQQLSRYTLTLLQVLVFLVFSFCVWKTGLGIMYTLFNPILSDSFGLTVKETSYYFTALMVMYVMGPFIL